MKKSQSIFKCSLYLLSVCSKFFEYTLSIGKMKHLQCKPICKEYSIMQRYHKNHFHSQKFIGICTQNKKPDVYDNLSRSFLFSCLVKSYFMLAYQLSSDESFLTQCMLSALNLLLYIKIYRCLTQSMSKTLKGKINTNIDLYK